VTNVHNNIIDSCIAAMLVININLWLNSLRCQLVLLVMLA